MVTLSNGVEACIGMRVQRSLDGLIGQITKVGNNVYGGPSMLLIRFDHGFGEYWTFADTCTPI